MNWQKEFKGKISLKEPLKKHSTFKIGGPAEYFVNPRDENNLKLLLKAVKKYKIPLRVIAGGSNLLISDKGIRGIVLSLDSPYFKKISFKGNCLNAGSGCPLSRIIADTISFKLSGLEFLAGIPGRVGGALIMNAGAWGKNIGDSVDSVRVIDYSGQIKTLSRKNIKFGYRNCSLDKYIILSACFKLIKKDKKEIKETVKEYLRQRSLTQDLSFSSAGCIFKNPKSNTGVTAGKLVDLCGLKGKVIGAARVSLRHANFIVNTGNAKAGDVLKLMELIKKKVKKRFNILLKPEIKIWS